MLPIWNPWCWRQACLMLLRLLYWLVLVNNLRILQILLLLRLQLLHDEFLSKLILLLLKEMKLYLLLLRTELSHLVCS